MSIWLVIALSIFAVGIVIGIICQLNWQWNIEFFNCLACAFGACVVEAIVYGFYKLIPWVVGWDTNVLTKVSFISIPATLVLAVVFVIAGCALDDAKRKIASRIFFTLTAVSVALFVASIFICPVAAWISSTAWRIAIWSPIGLVLAFVLAAAICGIWTDTNNATGCHTSYTSTHYDLVYDNGSRSNFWDTHGWDWGGPAV